MIKQLKAQPELLTLEFPCSRILFLFLVEAKRPREYSEQVQSEF